MSNAKVSVNGSQPAFSLFLPARRPRLETVSSRRGLMPFTPRPILVQVVTNSSMAATARRAKVGCQSFAVRPLNATLPVTITIAKYLPASWARLLIPRPAVGLS